MTHVLEELLRECLAHVHTTTPARVISYDAATQTCACQPALRHQQPLQSGRSTSVAMPALADVPVAHPRWGSWFVHAPLAPGDFVVLVFGEASIDRWRELGGVAVDPEFLHRFDLSDAIAVPENVYPIAAALAGLSANTFSFGKVGGPQIHMHDDGTISLGAAVTVDAVAKASAVLTQLTALATVLGTIGADMTLIAGALGGTIGTASAAAITALLMSPWPTSVASTKVKLNE